MDEKDRSRDRERSRRDRPSRFSEGSRDRSPADRGRDRGNARSTNNRVFISNIPYETRWQDLKDLFRDQVGEVQYVELFYDDNEKPKGCGILEFAESASAKKCLEVMQRYDIKGRKLIIKEDAGNARDKHGNVIGGRRNRDDGHRDRFDRDRDRFDRPSKSSGDWGNTYGLSPQFLESLHIEPPLSNKVFVANLEYNIDKKKIKDVFRLAGKVIRVEVPITKEGQSRGFAVVEYDHPVEAVQAISMLHNQVLNDRPMTVRMDRANDNPKLPEGLKSIGMGLGSNGEPLKNVAHNLPSLSSNNQSQMGSGILGAVPNQALQVANALSGLNNVVGANSFGNLANQQSLLSAANLSTLLGNGLSNSDLSLVQNSLVSNPLVQNQSQMSALSANNNVANIPALSSLTSNNMQNYNRSSGMDSNFSGGSISPFGQGQNFQNTNRNVTNAFDNNRSSNYNQGGNVGPFGQVERNNAFGGRTSTDSKMGGGGGSGSGYTRKVLVSNLPPSASYKMLHEKFNEYGDVKFFEEKGNGIMVVEFGSEWQAERAIKNMNGSRIDGREIDARLFL